MNTLQPLNETLFPIVLFVIYFCTASIFLHNQRQQNSVQSLPNRPQSFTIKEAFSPQYDPDPIEEELPVTEALDTQQNLEETLSPQQVNGEANQEEIVDPIPAIASQNIPCAQPNFNPQFLLQVAAIIDRLSKRQVRKLCTPLGIKQKTNGTELTAELMVASVRRKFKENPQQVIEAIASRLPELLPPQSPYQQQLTPRAC